MLLLLLLLLLLLATKVTSVEVVGTFCWFDSVGISLGWFNGVGATVGATVGGFAAGGLFAGINTNEGNGFDANFDKFGAGVVMISPKVTEQE